MSQKTHRQTESKFCDHSMGIRDVSERINGNQKHITEGKTIEKNKVFKERVKILGIVKIKVS